MTNQEPKKVLIVAYYWPPAGGPGVQRWLKFVKYLPEFNIKPILFVPDNPSYPIVDESLVKEIPKGMEIIRTPIREIYKLASIISKNKSKIISRGIIPKSSKQSSLEKLLLYVRGNYFIPDARIAWVNPSVDYLTKYISKNKIDTIITTGPPHSMHLIGLNLKKKLSIKWIADFRDPWTTIGYHKELKLTKNSQQKHLELEAEVLINADQIIVTSHHTKTEFESKTDRPIEVITNGYDEHEIETPKKDSKFTLAHIGSLLSDRNPKILWEVISELIEEIEEFRKNFKLKLVGTVSEEIMSSIDEHGLKKYTEYYGYLEHDEALVHQMSSRILLLIEIDSEETKAIIPGKFFEYLHSGTPILAIGPNGSDIETLIAETNSGRYFSYNSKDKIKNQLLRYFEDYQANNLLAVNKNIEKYSRKNLTQKLSQLI
ncbi:Glycosyltransferase Family 4 [Flavobacteriaceae bacterium MAR_2010_188]|nr:Glycosyltransferase Family 4 [Flavobacteriaceae bacterium MAR_2010_188]